jgi:pimeloyl-ACP methyl ester carboxylesterase
MQQLALSGRSVTTAKPRITRAPRRARIAHGLLGFASFLAVLALTGASYEAVASTQDAYRYPPPGQLVDVDGHQMHIACSGTGSPTIVLDAGVSGGALDWTPNQPALAATTRVCSYDRAGMGWSAPSAETRTPEHVAQELHTRLTNAGIAPPYVLVGHSLAGKNVRLFAAQHPDEVVGLVLIDARSEYVDLNTSEAEVQAFHQALKAQDWVYSVAHRLGVARLGGSALLGSTAISDEIARTILLQKSSTPALAAANAELIERAASDALLIAAPGLGDLPLVVLAAGQNLRDVPFWPEAQRQQAALSTQGRLLTVEASGHYIHWEFPSLVIDAVQDVVTRAQIQTSTKDSR